RLPLFGWLGDWLTHTFPATAAATVPKPRRIQREIEALETRCVFNDPLGLLSTPTVGALALFRDFPTPAEVLMKGWNAHQMFGTPQELTASSGQSLPWEQVQPTTPATPDLDRLFAQRTSEAPAAGPQQPTFQDAGNAFSA